MKKVMLALAVSLLLLVNTAQADSSKVTVVMNSGSLMTQGIALVLTNQMLDQGAEVKILLCDAAGDLALQQAPQSEPLKPNNVTPEQLLMGAMKKGAQVDVCALYLPNKGKQASDLKPGISSARPPVIAGELLEEKRKLLFF